jgi:glutathione S-transferase
VTVVTLYTRPGCHLCDEARAVIASLRDSHGPFELREVDIECAPELHARFLERIPVVDVDPQALSDALAAGTGTVRAMTSEATREPR